MKELHWNRYNAAADLDTFPDIRYQCKVCYKSFKEEYEECLNCGLVIKKPVIIAINLIVLLAHLVVVDVIGRKRKESYSAL